MDGVAASHWPLPESKEVASHSSGLAGIGRFLSAWSDGLFEGCEARGGLLCSGAACSLAAPERSGYEKRGAQLALRVEVTLTCRVQLLDWNG